MMAYTRAVHPLLRLLNALGNGLLRLVRVEPQDELNAVYTGRQLVGVLAESREAGLLDADEHGLAAGALVLEQRTTRDAMVPLADAVTVREGMSAGQLEAQVASTGLSRFPVVRADGGLEHYVHVHDLVAVAGGPLERRLEPDALRPLVTLPDGMPLVRALVELRDAQRHLARVVDASGTVVGLLSLDDVVRPLLERGAGRSAS
jgi:CBS domain containing-hemolysin-like protein